MSSKPPRLQLPQGLARFGHFKGSASERRRRLPLERFSVREQVPQVTSGWRALALPALIAPFVYVFQRARHARAGKIALVTLIVAPVLVVLSWFKAGFEEVQQQVQKAQEHHEEFVARKDTTFLILGTDDVPTKDSRRRAGRSDTMLLANVQYSKKRVRVLSVPRDTFVMVDYGRGIRGDKIAHAFRRGKVGWQASKAAVERLTRLKIDNYATVDYGLFREFIDAIDGVHMTIEKRMFYEDKAGGLFIDFQPGEIVLNGQKALEYVRFRKDGKGDMGRIARQQRFLKAVVNKLLAIKAWKNLFRSDTMRRILQHLDTDFEVSQVVPLAVQFRGADAGAAFAAGVLPGKHALRETRWSGGRPLSYFFADQTKLDDMLDSWFLSQPRPPPTPAEAAVRAEDVEAARGVMAAKPKADSAEGSLASSSVTTKPAEKEALPKAPPVATKPKPVLPPPSPAAVASGTGG